jgi:AcrR family transcriptional regulator
MPPRLHSDACVDASNAHKPKPDTKYNLILSALELFAENGVDAVSMRTINNAAGTRNASAVHYHFGNKLGIIEAIIAFIREALDTSRLDALVALEERVRNGERPSCREIMWAAFVPYYRLYNTPEYGQHALRFLARLQIDMSPEVRDILNNEPQRIAHRFDALLARALPDLPDNIRRMRYIYFWTLTVHMFAGSGHLDSTVFGDLRTCVDEDALQRCFDYLVGGMEGPVSARLTDAPASIR